MINVYNMENYQQLISYRIIYKIVTEINMGNSLSCFHSATSNKKKAKQSIPVQQKYAIPSLTQLNIWKNQFGMSDKNKLLDFTYASDIDHHSFKQIDKDIGRTFPDSQFFMKPKNQESFKNILKKFSVYFPKTGYTQGINFIAGYLLLSGCEEIQVFTLMAKMCTHHNLMLIGLFEDQFPLNRVYCALFWEILTEKQPQLVSKIKQLNVPDQLWVFQWFMTFFIYSFPLYIVRSLFTVIFQQKGMTVVKLAYSLTLQIKQQINKCTQQIHFLQLNQRLKNRQFCHKHINVTNLIENSNKISEAEIRQYLYRINMSNNFYLSYFKLEDNDRKIRNVQFLNRLHEERKGFIAEPKSAVFARNANDISLLDSLESISYIKLYQSLLSQRHKIDEEMILEKEQGSTRMWSSDLMHLDSKQLTIASVTKKQQTSVQINPKAYNFKKK